MQAKVKRLHYILTGLTLVIVAVSLNRLTHLTTGYLQPHEFLRWLDINGMVIIPLATIILYYLLMKNIRGNGQFYGGRVLLWLELIFTAGMALYAISGGNHEPMNYLNGRFCAEPSAHGQLCEAVRYHDDVFSHWLYYAGVILVTLALLGIERLRPNVASIHKHDLWFILVNAGLIAAGIFANLAFEPAALDMGAFAILTLLSVGFLTTAPVWIGRLPVTIYFATAYGVGFVATLMFKLVAR
jgi:hypothetical protein